jgi:hypothetical protein
LFFIHVSPLPTGKAGDDSGEDVYYKPGKNAEEPDVDDDKGRVVKLEK